MKGIAINIVFLFIMGLIATIIITGIYLAIKNFVIDYFSEKPQTKKFKELETKYLEYKVSESFLMELGKQCARESIDNYACLNGYVVCYYIFSEHSFQNLAIPYVEEFSYKNKTIVIDATNFDSSKNNTLIVFDCNQKAVYFLN